jgi:hypothetical protein
MAEANDLDYYNYRCKKFYGTGLFIERYLSFSENTCITLDRISDESLRQSITQSLRPIVQNLFLSNLHILVISRIVA